MPPFNSPSFGKVEIDKVVDQIIEFIKEEPKYRYSIIVGSDSQNDHNYTQFVAVILVHRRGAGGRFFWRRFRKKRINTLRNRIYEEANLSIQTANKVMKLLKEKTKLKYNVEIHVDIGEKGKTKEFIQEIVGMIKGIGFKVKTKPEAYGASTVADRYT